MSTQPTLLLIASDLQLRYLINRYATRSGCRVINTSTIDGAVAHILHDPPSMVLLHVMSQYDGWAMLRRLKAEQSLPGIPITIIAAIVDEARARAEGAAHWLWQPVMYSDFLAAIASTTGPATSTEAYGSRADLG
ncbi:MAG TPA: hypothetical protein VGD69_30845 [Herpetosiphonaceae bacterium]